MEVIALWGFWFVFILTIDFCLFCWAAAAESGIGGVFLLALTVAILHWAVQGLNVFGAIEQYWVVYTLIGGWLLLQGLLWSFFKWYRYVKRNADDFVAYDSNGKYDYSKPRTTRLRDHKDRITSWIVLSTFSIVWFVIEDGVKAFAGIFRKTYEKLMIKAIQSKEREMMTTNTD